MKNARLNFFITLIFLSTVAVAQEKNGFFERGFADKVAGIEVPKDPPKKKAGSEEEASVGGSETEVTTGEKSGFDLSSAEIEVKEPLIKDEPIDGKPVFYVGAILSGVDLDQFKADLEVYLDALSERAIPSGVVFVVGNMDAKFGEQNFRKILRRGGRVEYIFELPERYKNVQSTPTWIIGLNEGEVLLEGLGPLKQFFNSQGLYLGEKAGAPLG